MTRNINGSRKEVSAEIQAMQDGPIRSAMQAAFSMLPAPIVGEGDVQITVQNASDAGGTTINISARLAHPAQSR